MSLKYVYKGLIDKIMNISSGYGFGQKIMNMSSGYGFVPSGNKPFPEPSVDQDSLCLFICWHILIWTTITLIWYRKNTIVFLFMLRTVS